MRGKLTSLGYIARTIRHPNCNPALYWYLNIIMHEIKPWAFRDKSGLSANVHSVLLAFRVLPSHFLADD